MACGTAAPARDPCHSCQVKLPCNRTGVGSPTGSPATPPPPAAPNTLDSLRHWAGPWWIRLSSPPTSFAVVCGHSPSGRVWCFAVCISGRQAATRLPPIPPSLIPAITPPPPLPPSSTPSGSAGLLVAGRAGPPPSLAPMQIGRTCAVHLSVSSLQATLPPAVDVFGFTAKAPS